MPGRCGAASARRGGDGRLALDPIAALQGDRRARLKAGGCLPLPFYVGLDPAPTNLTQLRQQVA